MRYTVKQLAKLAGVTPRTLHYYDAIGLLRPANYGDNGYRFYGEEAVLRLQQILFYRELDFSLEQIKAILDRPDFDLLQALQSHRNGLLERIQRLNNLITTVDRTMQHIRGESTMEQQDFYAGFDEQQQEEYAVQAEQMWGESVAQSQKRWKGYSREQKNAILGEMHAISAGLAEAMDSGPESPAAQELIGRWHRHINRYFYPCSLEVFAALGRMYPEDPQFRATYEKIRPGMAEFMEQAMSHYCAVMAVQEG
jgi:DNA-binding transcriptional MerR regulator